MISLKVSTMCRSTSSACLENKSAVFIKFLPDRVLNVGGKGSKEKIYQVSAYTPRYHSWVGGTWTPWNTGMPWEEGKIEIFNARVTIPEKGLSTHASQYFIFTYGAFRKPLCKNIPSG